MNISDDLSLFLVTAVRVNCVHDRIDFTNVS